MAAVPNVIIEYPASFRNTLIALELFDDYKTKASLKKACEAIGFKLKDDVRSENYFKKKAIQKKKEK